METKYHRVYARIDLDAICSNIRNIRRLIHEKSDDTKVMAVIKADAYGHGDIPIAHELEKEKIDYLAVAIYQEGIRLREEGIKTPILVLGNTPEEAFESLIDYDLTQTVYTSEMGRALNKVAEHKGKRAKIHIKIDSGMGRIGLRAIHQPVERVINAIRPLKDSKGLDIEGIFTHFSKADETDPAYTELQIQVFNDVVEALKKEGINIKYVHASNSAGILAFPQAHYSMVRAGIIMYGLYPSEEVEKIIPLKPALSIISHVVLVKTVEAGEYISYGGIYQTSRTSRIATIPVGYADGYSRALSNRGRVLIRGQYAPVIGRVCMDQIMVDVTDIPDVSEEDEVVLIGSQKDKCVTVEEIADIMDTINYEVICLIGKRVPRIYVKEKKIVEAIDYFY